MRTFTIQDRKPMPNLNSTQMFEQKIQSRLIKEEAAWNATHERAYGRDREMIRYQASRGMSVSRLVGIYGASCVNYALGSGPQ